MVRTSPCQEQPVPVCDSETTWAVLSNQTITRVRADSSLKPGQNLEETKPEEKYQIPRLMGSRLTKRGTMKLNIEHYFGSIQGQIKGQ